MYCAMNLTGPPPILLGGELGGFKRCFSCLREQDLLSITGQSRVDTTAEWTDFERATIQDVFSQMDDETVGPAALSRCLVVYPWTQRYFGNFGNLSNAAAIMGNPRLRNTEQLSSKVWTYAELSLLQL
ncbi:Hemoglobin subunit beta-2 [Liparis tanakae]|uniref:Hemoglobin subunit beta-2 n=1 Tax=Liparis tanakae TaxID=230148 RepID=A0A4Z2I875_9TELE|nr:Hemoglobin subunit beta-2 [Liparis tanakae]